MKSIALVARDELLQNHLEHTDLDAGLQCLHITHRMHWDWQPVSYILYMDSWW